MRRRSFVSVATLVMLAGCTGYQSWELIASGTIEEADGVYHFTGEVGLTGNSGGVTVDGVRVVFLDANGSTLETVRIGMLGDDRQEANVSVDLDRPPKYILVRVSSIDAPENSEYGITGLERRDDGRYYPYSEYDPIV